VGALPPFGRATRVADERGEVWWFEAADAPVVRRLVALGEVGVGGFEAWGEEDGGARVWARRSVPRETAEARRAMGWRAALEALRLVAAALAACERASLFPGEIHPSSIALAPRVWIEAEAAVSALVGGEPPPTRARVGRFTPPEQAAGAAWDAAANRYVLGLLAYRWVTGAHPFEGEGLRQSLAGQALGAPPFEPEVLARTRPGVQALILSLLAPDPNARPRDAAAIVKRCDDLLEDRPRIPVAVAPPPSPPAPPARPRPAAPARRPPRALRVAALVVLLAAVAAAAVPPAPTPAPSLPPVRSLTGTRASSCAPCHAREVAEWTRSVMAHAARSPLFGALESVVEEQVGQERACPHGAGVLRPAGSFACRSADEGLAVTGAGGERWCVHCHAPAARAGDVPAWSATGSRSDRSPLIDLLSPEGLDGITCTTCHEAIGPVDVHARAQRRGAYEGNATWTSPFTGEVFSFRPEDATGLSGISNSGYALDPASFLAEGGAPHRLPSDAARAYARSSEACGACHDVRLFGTDVLGGAARGEHFKRLRNAYSEWRDWARTQASQGRAAPTCQGCHMSLYPGVCAEGGDGGAGCARGTHFEAHAPGDFPRALVAPSSVAPAAVAVHTFASVDFPLTRDLPAAFVDDPGRDAFGLPLGLRARRDLLLAHALALSLGAPAREGGRLLVPVQIENVGAGHRVPAGFSQEREIWVELTVRDAGGGTVYQVGHVERGDEDLHDKVFLRVNTDDAVRDRRGRPLGVFGADVADGPDVPRWSPPPGGGATSFRGQGLVNLQNGFFRCVRCIGVIDARGACQPGPGQGVTRADRFADGVYDLDTGRCESNLDGTAALFETYFPVGALDASRGVVRAPDAILDTRSAPPGVPLTYTYALDPGAAEGPFQIEARLLFRAFPPYLIRSFAAYETEMDARGLRPSGPQVDLEMLRRLEVVELARAEVRAP
jgi:hypothetical protein